MLVKESIKMIKGEHLSFFLLLLRICIHHVAADKHKIFNKK